MTTELHLDTYLDRCAAKGRLQADAAAAVLAIAKAGRTLADILAAGPLAGAVAETPGGASSEWDGASRECGAQRALDVRSHDLMLTALSRAPVASVLSEAAEHPVTVTAGGSLCVAIGPSDGFADVDTNAPVGTIFSVLPANRSDPLAGFLAPGHTQIAAGFMIYGANTSLIVTLGDGTGAFTLDRARDAFVAVSGPIAIPPQTSEYAINASNRRHWEPAVRTYVEDCQAGAEGPRGRDFDTSWIASLVAEAYRIMVRGGIYLYPADSRPAYRQGRLRLIYEANPVALLAEQAGGAATDGRSRILDLRPGSLHQRTALVFGSREEVAEVARCYARPPAHAASPLFTSRSLFRV